MRWGKIIGSGVSFHPYSYLLPIHDVHHASVSLPQNGALPKLFPTVSFPSTKSTLPSRSLPTELSPSYFPRFPVRPRCPSFRLASSQRSSPQAISRGFLPVQDVHASVSPRQNGALPKLFPTVSWCPRFRLAPSKRSSPQAISHGFQSVHDVHASVLLPRDKVSQTRTPLLGKTKNGTHPDGCAEFLDLLLVSLDLVALAISSQPCVYDIYAFGLWAFYAKNCLVSKNVLCVCSGCNPLSVSICMYINTFPNSPGIALTKLQSSTICKYRFCTASPAPKKFQFLDSKRLHYTATLPMKRPRGPYPCPLPQHGIAGSLDRKRPRARMVEIK